jgi:hypothetical protein
MNAYPENDGQFEETTIAKVRHEGDGWEIKRADGWSIFIEEGLVEPKVGMTARFYGKGIGYSVRGIFVDGRKVFYRTEAEEVEHREIESYGADAADWLKRWDDGKGVWSVEMGGLGPGYEQCIQITTAEVLRHLLEKQYDFAQWSDAETWKRDREAIEQAGFANPVITALGLSGAQWGAALSLATVFYKRGPRAALTDEAVKDRRIQVCRVFPGSAS